MPGIITVKTITIPISELGIHIHLLHQNREVACNGSRFIRVVVIIQEIGNRKEQKQLYLSNLRKTICIIKRCYSCFNILNEITTVVPPLITNS